jgi:hypothetical protein
MKKRGRKKDFVSHSLKKNLILNYRGPVKPGLKRINK